MGFVISEGAYSDGGFLTSIDGGNSWVFYDRPSTGFGTFMQKEGRFWLIGMEVVGKDQPGGGYSIPLMAASANGVAWSRIDRDISICHWQGCTTCNLSGCLLANNQLIDLFGDGAIYTFAANDQALSPNFASLHTEGKSVICSVAGRLRCAPMRKAGAADKMGQPAPRFKTFEIPGIGVKDPHISMLLSPTAYLFMRLRRGDLTEFAQANMPCSI